MICVRRSRRVASRRGPKAGTCPCLWPCSFRLRKESDCPAHDGRPGSWGRSALSESTRLSNHTGWPLVNGDVPGPQHSKSRPQWGAEHDQSQRNGGDQQSVASSRDGLRLARGQPCRWDVNGGTLVEAPPIYPVMARTLPFRLFQSCPNPC